MDNDMPMMVFGMEPNGNVTKAILGEEIGTLVHTSTRAAERGRAALGDRDAAGQLH
jgi:hypothetical protein